MKKIVIGLIAVFVLFTIAILIVGRTFYPDNVAETSKDGGEKHLKTRVYKTDIVSVTKTVNGIVPTLSTYGSAWKIVDESGDGSVKSIKIEVPVIIFTDDLEVEIVVETEGEVTINVRSTSRVGKSDFGENARHVRKILSELDKKIAEETQP